MDHQRIVLKAQLELASRFGRPVSVHSVQAHGVIFQVMQSLWKGHEKPSKRERKRRLSALRAHEAEDERQEKGGKAQESLPYPPRICMHSYSGPPDALKQFLGPTVPADIYFSFSTVVNFSTASSAKVTNVIKAVPDDRILIESDVHCAGTRMDELLRDIILRVCEIKGWPLGEGVQRLKENWNKFVFG